MSHPAQSAGGLLLPETPGLDVKSISFDPAVLTDDGRIAGYASLFGLPDQGNDVVMPGAFARSLAERRAPVRFLWQHDASEPIGVWDEVTETANGLYVSGRLALATRRGAEALALLRMGAIDGVSIGYRTVRASKDPETGRRQLHEIDLWEVSLVTFPMLPEARITRPQPHIGATPAVVAATDSDPTLASLLAALTQALQQTRAALKPETA